jgi:hypothetical protein
MSKDLMNLTPEERQRREEALLNELAKFGVTRENFRQAYEALRLRIQQLKKTG